MKAFIVAMVALVIISVGANQFLMSAWPSSAEASVSSSNVRLSD